MELRFTQEPIPELTFTGSALARNGFTAGMRVALQHKHPILYIVVVNDNTTWDTYCETSQHNPMLGADWVDDDGQLVIGGDWLTNLGITQADHVDAAIAPGIIIIRRRADGILKV
ncbi:hypothetical protein [Ewingella americana]|jgi:hypothetical protein|uniref:Type I toxin-antitoxin system SymE family toxin n=1 Tax=Ewingella americana TaxID=41202 RepID=A0A502GQS8_9GAMM|nr:hypothetical protein [Ewingella americana]TPG63346.1 hypothetical protein EAH77_07195 [Ewingella americana]